jgi:dTDP-4-dehydrorhamnose reductase
LEAEDKLKEILEELWILRFTWLFGLPERNMPVNPNILWNAVEIALGGRKSAVATGEYRGHTYGYEMLDAIMKVPDLPYDTYHIGSRNDLDRYDITRYALTEMGLGSRLSDLLEADPEKFKEAPRDIRLNTDKLAAAGVRFSDSTEAITRCLKEFGLYHLF